MPASNVHWFIQHESFWKCLFFSLLNLFLRKLSLSKYFIFHFLFTKVFSVLTNLIKQQTSTVSIYGLNLCIKKGSNKIWQKNIFRSWFEFLLVEKQNPWIRFPLIFSVWFEYLDPSSHFFFKDLKKKKRRISFYIYETRIFETQRCYIVFHSYFSEA